jgi:hypothetical protein
LNRPPDILKNAHAFTASENPNASDMKSKLEELGVCVKEPSRVAGAAALATWVAANAMNKNIKVPPNSAS